MAFNSQLRNAAIAILDRIGWPMYGKRQRLAYTTERGWHWITLRDGIPERWRAIGERDAMAAIGDLLLQYIDIRFGLFSNSATSRPLRDGLCVLLSHYGCAVWVVDTTGSDLAMYNSNSETRNLISALSFIYGGSIEESKIVHQL